MPDRARVYLEVGTKKVFAMSVDWPGWGRAARDEDGALKALVSYAERYRRTIGTASRGMPRPTSIGDLDVIARVKGDASTDYGVPGQRVDEDEHDVDSKELKR